MNSPREASFVLQASNSKQQIINEYTPQNSNPDKKNSLMPHL